MLSLQAAYIAAPDAGPHRGDFQILSVSIPPSVRSKGCGVFNYMVLLQVLLPLATSVVLRVVVCIVSVAPWGCCTVASDR